MSDVDIEADLGGEILSLVDEGEMPQVVNEGSILKLCRSFGRLAPKLDLYEVNDEVFYFNYRRERKLMTGRHFRSWIEKHVIVTGGFDRKTGAPQMGSLQLNDALDVLDSDTFKQGVRRINHENDVRLPVVRENGDMELLPEGYDEETGVYTVPGGLVYDMDWSYVQGKEWFDKWFGEMPYSDERSRSVMVAGLLTLFVKHLPGGNGLRPGFIWEANKAGSGKSLCAGAACAIVLGYIPTGIMKKGEELDKAIESYVRSKCPVIFFDNLYGSLRNATMDLLVTSKLLTFRGMGGQSMVTLSNEAPLFLTGNEVEKNDDAHRRYLQCYLFEKSNPDDRSVENLLTPAKMSSDEWRKEALAALWSFVKNWDEKGRPNGPTTRGSFEEFSWLMGGIVTAAGYSDPLERPAEDDGLSPEQADFVELVKGLFKDFNDEGLIEKKYGLNEMARVARSLDIFGDKIGDEEAGKREHIKQERISGEYAGHVVDEGHLTPQQLQHWAALMKKKIGQEISFDGITVLFGDRVLEKRKAKFTVKVV